jgi:hypothetical protein
LCALAGVGNNSKSTARSRTEISRTPVRRFNILLSINVHDHNRPDCYPLISVARISIG